MRADSGAIVSSVSAYSIQFHAYLDPQLLLELQMGNVYPKRARRIVRSDDLAVSERKLCRWKAVTHEM